MAVRALWRAENTISASRDGFSVPMHHVTRPSPRGSPVKMIPYIYHRGPLAERRLHTDRSHYSRLPVLTSGSDAPIWRVWARADCDGVPDVASAQARATRELLTRLTVRATTHDSQDSSLLAWGICKVERSCYGAWQPHREYASQVTAHGHTGRCLCPPPCHPARRHG